MWFICMCTSVMFHVGFVVVQNWLSWPFTVLVEGRPGSEPGGQFITELTFRSWQSLGFSSNLHCFQNKKSTEHNLGVGLSYEYFGLLVVSAASVVMGFIGKHHSAPGKWGMFLTSALIWLGEKHFIFHLWVFVGCYPEFTVLFVRK